MKNENCLLEQPNCDRRCAHCGWDPAEVERRKTALAENGLTLCEDGLYRLVIKRGE